MRLMSAMFLVCLVPVAAATERPGSYESRTCADDWVCVYTVVGEDDAVSFRARNLSDYPVTVGLRVRPRNLSSEGGNSRTSTLAGGADRELLGYERSKPGGRTDYRFWFDWSLGHHNADHDDKYLYRLPYASGRRYRVLQGFGSRFSHTGNERYAVDFDMRVGTAVHAARDGVVARVVSRHGAGCWAARCAGKANYIVVLHADGSTGEYYHLKRSGALVKPGERVKRGQKIGLSGNSGHSTMPHLHFGVYDVDDRGNTRSLKFRFEGADGVIDKPRRGPGYVAN